MAKKRGNTRREFLFRTSSSIATVGILGLSGSKASLNAKENLTQNQNKRITKELNVKKTESKSDGFPLYYRPSGKIVEGIDDGRPVVIISDFSRCQPSNLLNVKRNDTEGSASGKWTIKDFETERFSGRMLYAHRSYPAGDITLPLNVKGWYAVYVWLMGADTDLEEMYPLDFECVYSESKGPALKLTGDDTFSSMFKTLTHDLMAWPGLEACFWRYNDLTGKHLVIRHQGSTVHLGAVELIPLSPSEVKAVQKDRADSSHKRLIIKNDHPGPNSIETTVENFRNRDIAAWIVGNEDSKDLFTPKASPKLLLAKRAVHEIGAEYYVCDRPSLWSTAFDRIEASTKRMLWEGPRTRFFKQHPEWHCKDRDGTDNHQMSYAVPEVVNYMLERCRQTAKNEPDGFGYFFNRDPGLVLFEPAAMNGFEDKYGMDPTTLDDRDERLLSWRAGFITEFMRKVRTTLDEVEKERGCKRIKMIAVVLGGESVNHFFSLDVPQWVKEGLVDILCPYPWTDYPDRWLSQGFVDVDVKYFSELVKGSSCKLYPMWLSGDWRCHWTPEHVRINEYFTKAFRDYADGADGISVWDMMHEGTAAFKANRLLRLGHKEKLLEWTEDDFPLPPKLRFTSLAGATPERYPAGAGG